MSTHPSAEGEEVMSQTRESRIAEPEARVARLERPATLTTEMPAAPPLPAELLRAVLDAVVYLDEGRGVTVRVILSDPPAHAAHMQHLERQGVAVVTGRRGPRRPARAGDRSVFFSIKAVQRLSSGWAISETACRALLRCLPQAKGRQRSVAGELAYGVEVPLESVCPPAGREG
jgi:hypothetical protein